MSDIYPKPTYQEGRLARMLDSLAFDLASLIDADEPPSKLTVRLLKLALIEADEYAARVEKHGEESATAQVLAERFAEGDDR